MGNNLRPAMNHRIGIWIDHAKAVIVSTSADGVAVSTVESEAGRRARHAEGPTTPTLGGIRDSGENPHRQLDAQHRERYYDEIITQLGHPAALLIFGPAEAKTELTKRLSRFKTLAGVVGLETTDTLTDPQIVAKVKRHYGIEVAALA